MKKIDNLKKMVSLAIIIVVLVILTVVLFLKNADLKYQLFYEERSVPDVELINYLSVNSNMVSGSLTGFVVFDNKEKQPHDLKQYIEITALKYSDKDGKQLFQERDIIKMNSLPPRYFDPVILTTNDSSGGVITLSDTNGNLFFIDKSTKEVKMINTTGDITRLITDDLTFRDFIREFLK